MEIGQWVRDDNYIVQFNGYCDCTWCKDRGFEEPILKGKEYFEYITTQKMWDKYLKRVKVADTPQELIQDNDLGFIKEWNSIETLYTSNEGVYCYMDSKRHFIGKNITITKILTPNSNGGYDLQWNEDGSMV